MAPTHRQLVERLMEQHGRTFAEEVEIPLAHGTPSVLFQLLVTALLLSARISAYNAVTAARALRAAGLTTPERMARATWQERVDVITWHGYKRYDERTSTMLGKLAERVRDIYGGDLGRLRDEAGHDVHKEHALLQQFTGIGPVGADIFLREVQGMWPEVYPYVDAKMRRSASRLGLPEDPNALAKLVPREDFPRLASALVRADLRSPPRAMGVPAVGPRA
jgi:endonuclease III